MNRKKAASSASPKLYRSIREVSAELDVKPHVLRYWETQFPSLRPKKNRAGNRMYRPEEVKLLTRIKELLYAQRFTIEGARRLLTDEKKPRATKTTATAGAQTAVAPVAPVAVPASTHDAERKRLEKALAGAQAELAHKEDSLVAAKQALSASQAQLAEHKSSIATLDDRDKTRMAAMAVLRQELLLLARELRGENEKAAPAPALLETRVTVKASEEPVERAATPDPELAPEREPEALPLGVVAISVGA